MFRQALTRATPVLKAASAPAQARGYAKATIVGRLGAAPVEHVSASSGKPYYIYSVAVSRPPKKDASGEIVRNEQGYPVRETDWYSVFNFREGAKASMERLGAGDLVLVDAVLSTRKTQAGDVVETETLLNESTHRVLDRAAREAAA